MTEHLTEGPRVGISGAVPRARSSTGAAGAHSIPAWPSRRSPSGCSGRGPILVHGSHPTLSVLIQELAGSDPEAPKRVWMFASRFFIHGEYERDFFEEHLASGSGRFRSFSTKTSKSV